MKEFVCLYSVIYDYDDGEGHKLKTDQGMLFADNFTDAVSQLENTLYGTDLVQIVNVELFDTLPTFSAETIKIMKEELESR
jgi:hypothetical protein